MPSSYSDTHRLFLQASIAEHFFSETKGLEIYKCACEATQEQYRKEDYDEFITTINSKLNTVDMEFRKGHDESTGEVMWALVNTNGDEVAKLATEYNPLEISYFKHLIDLIVTADDEAFSVSSITALRESSRLKSPMTKNAAETLLQKFIDDKWLLRSTEGRYSLSLRAVLELQNYLKEQFEEMIQECTLCFDIVTKGQRCNVQRCPVRLHHHCAQRYFAQQPEKVCPICKSAWRENMVVGGGQATPRARKRFTFIQRGEGGNRRVNNSDDDTSECD